MINVETPLISSISKNKVRIFLMAVKETIPAPTISSIALPVRTGMYRFEKTQATAQRIERIIPNRWGFMRFNILK